MTTEAPKSPLEAVHEGRSSFIQAAEEFMLGAMEGYAAIEERAQAAATQYQVDLTKLNADHAEEVQRLRLAATTATAAAEEQLRHRTALATAAEASLDARTAEAAAAAVSEATAAHDVQVQAIREAHDQQIQSLHEDHAATVSGLHLGFAAAVEAAKEALTQALKAEHAADLVAANEAKERIVAELAAAHEADLAEASRQLAAASSSYEQAAAEAAAAYGLALTEERNQGALKAASAHTMWLAADGARVASEAKLAEAQETIRQLQANTIVAPEIEDILYPQAPAADELALVKSQLEEARTEIATLRDAERQSTSTVEGLRSEVDRLHLESELTPEPVCTHGEPDPTVASMKVARFETQTIVRLVAEANPQVTLVEAADLVGAALLGRTETAVPLPMPVLAGAAA